MPNVSSNLPPNTYFYFRIELIQFFSLIILSISSSNIETYFKLFSFRIFHNKNAKKNDYRLFLFKFFEKKYIYRLHLKIHSKMWVRRLFSSSRQFIFAFIAEWVIVLHWIVARLIYKFQVFSNFSQICLAEFMWNITIVVWVSHVIWFFSLIFFFRLKYFIYHSYTFNVIFRCFFSHTVNHFVDYTNFTKPLDA